MNASSAWNPQRTQSSKQHESARGKRRSPPAKGTHPLAVASKGRWWLGWLWSCVLLVMLPGCDTAEQVAAKKVEQAVAVKSAASSTEAKQNLALLAAGAQTYYSAEHALRDGTITTHRFPEARSWVCSEGGDPKQPAAAGSTNWKKEPWDSLRFQLGEHRYQYCYQSAREGAAFAASAELDEQLFCVTGRAEGGQLLISAVVELSMEQDCELPKTPSR